jgi:creatinine amidohydrolase
MLTTENTTKEIAAAQPEMAVWGIGAIEQHGPALPVGTDWIAISDFARRVAERLDAFLVPALPFSMSECHGPMHGTVWLKPWTLAAVVKDVVRSLRAQGFKRVVMLNGHGGNFVLESAIRELNLAYDDTLVIMPENWFVLPGPEEAPIFLTEEIHAGEGETSSQLYLNSENVRKQRVDFIPPVGREFLDYATMGYISPYGVWGLGSYGSAKHGKQATERRVERLVAIIQDRFARLETLQENGQ